MPVVDPALTDDETSTPEEDVKKGSGKVQLIQGIKRL
jgi:hypothetical protein